MHVCVDLLWPRGCAQQAGVGLPLDHTDSPPNGLSESSPLPLPLPGFPRQPGALLLATAASAIPEGFCTEGCPADLVRTPLSHSLTPPLSPQIFSSSFLPAEGGWGV